MTNNIKIKESYHESYIKNVKRLINREMDKKYFDREIAICKNMKFYSTDELREISQLNKGKLDDISICCLKVTQ